MMEKIDFFSRYGLKRRIERHNFLIYNTHMNYIRSLDFYGRVVDLGCGNAPYKDIIIEKGGEYIGVDHEGTRYDRQKATVFADLSKTLPFKAEHADIVICFNVLDDLPEPGLFLSECYRILRDGGMFHLMVPFAWPIHEEPHDYYRFTRYGLEYLLKKSGFVDISVEEETGFWQSWLLKINYYSVQFARGPIKYLFYVFWYFNQLLAPMLDGIDRTKLGKSETSHYVVRARKNLSKKNHETNTQESS